MEVLVLLGLVSVTAVAVLLGCVWFKLCRIKPETRQVQARVMRGKSRRANFRPPQANFEDSVRRKSTETPFSDELPSLPPAYGKDTTTDLFPPHRTHSNNAYVTYINPECNKKDDWNPNGQEKKINHTNNGQKAGYAIIEPIYDMADDLGCKPSKNQARGFSQHEHYLPPIEDQFVPDSYYLQLEADKL